MKYLTVFTLVCIVLITSVEAAENESVALTIKVKGDVTLLREEEESSVRQGQQLFNQDILESAEESYAAIKFIDGSSIVKLFPNSILEIKADKKEQDLEKKSILKMGELWAKVTGQTGSFEMETPTTVVSVKGTKFLLSVSENGYTSLYTFSGIVEMRNKLDENTVEVGAGQQASTSGEGEILIEDLDLDQLDEELQDYIEESSETLEIELENEEGDTRSIRIELE